MDHDGGAGDHDHGPHGDGEGHGHGTADGIEWEDDMVESTG
jgi:hypothetical protein